jgi:hypothetical protein
MSTRARASIDDLYRIPAGCKAEIVRGGVVLMPPSGGRSGYAGDEVFASRRDFVRRTGRGRAVGDNKGFHVDLPTDYFEAGTLVVWDLDLLSRDVVRVDRSDNQTLPQIYRVGEVADAEPAVPGWRMRVDDLLT